MEVLKRPRRSGRYRIRLQMDSVGDRGEALAASYLREKGYDVLARNFRYGRNEVDLICLDPEKDHEVVFVEVKTRSTTAFGPPEASITDEKRSALIEVARGYLFERGREGAAARFDVVGVRLTGEQPRIDHHENAFLAE